MYACFPSTLSSTHRVCMVTHIARVWVNRVRLPILLVVSRTGKMIISLFPFAPENLVSRDGFCSPVPRQPAHSLHSGRIWCLFTGLLRSSGRRPFIYLFKPPYAIGQSRVYRVTQLHTDGVHCRESAGTGPVKPQGSSERVLPWQVHMDQLICASLFHTHY